MGSIDSYMSQVAPTRMQRGEATRRLRPPWRRGTWAAAEVALALQAQRTELVRAAVARGDARGVPRAVLEEIVDEGICTVVMMRRPITCEEHLMGAFWTAVRLLLRHHREGRHRLRVGTRTRTDFEFAAVRAAAEGSTPDEVVELGDRVARAADFMAQLSDLERQVVAVMAVRGTGIKLTARILDLPANTVKAAARSAQSKLDRVAAIAAAGRMCSYRQAAIVAHANGSARAPEEQMARAHLAACAACRSSYTQIVREMRRREFQRGAAAAFLPAPSLALGHHLGLLARLLGKAADRRLPSGGVGERAAEALGGAGVVKVAAAGGAAVVMATATIATGVHSLAASSQHHIPRQHHRGHSLTQPQAVQHVVVPSTEVGAAGLPVRLTPSQPRLSPQQHAYREFGADRAHIASAHASSASIGTNVERSEPSTTRGESTTNSGPSPAAREFGQP
jgi:hypothetical protein